jgi:hypothetical protein
MDLNLRNLAMSMNEKCPIWGTPADVEPKDKHIRALIISPRAGGKYIVQGYIEERIQQLDTKHKISLTNWILDKNRFGRPPTITSKILEQAKSWPNLSVFQRADHLLRYYGKQTNHVGDEVVFRANTAANALYGNKDDGTGHLGEEFYEMMAWSGSCQENELLFLLNFLSEKCFLSKIGAISSSYKNKIGYVEYIYTITPKGYAHLEELDGANPESSQAFVAMWFDDSMKNAYEKGIEPAIYDSGYKPMLINQKQHIGKIDDQIIAEIRRSRFLVADFTAGEKDCGKDETIHVPRGGVYYEAGFAQGLNIPVIWTCKKDQMERIHFDTRQFNHITWENAEDLYEQLKNRIGAVIGDGPIQNKQSVG